VETPTSRELVSLLFYLRIEISLNNPEVMDSTMKHRLENMLGYLESESYLMAYRTLNAIVTENEASGELPSLETSTALEVMQTCLRIIVGERVGHPEVAKHFAQTVSFYERLALLLTKKLLGDDSAAAEVDILLFCHDALAKHRRN
jgi:hypothetical protein